VKSKVQNCLEVKEIHGMTVGLPPVRYICPCGYSTNWNKSQVKARKELYLHANTCDTALWMFLDIVPPEGVIVQS
jgi:hypothetical protein